MHLVIFTHWSLCWDTARQRKKDITDSLELGIDPHVNFSPFSLARARLAAVGGGGGWGQANLSILPVSPVLRMHWEVLAFVLKATVVCNKNVVRVDFFTSWLNVKNCIVIIGNQKKISTSGSFGFIYLCFCFFFWCLFLSIFQLYSYSSLSFLSFSQNQSPVVHKTNKSSEIWAQQ